MRAGVVEIRSGLVKLFFVDLGEQAARVGEAKESKRAAKNLLPLLVLCFGLVNVCISFP